MSDGGGHTSWADHTVPHAKAPLAPVTAAWLQWAHDHHLPQRILAHIRRKGVPEPPLTPDEADQAARLAFQALQQPCPLSLLPEQGQNFRLTLVETLASASRDIDLGLMDMLRSGVRTGALTPLPTSHQWAPVENAVPNEDLDLELCEGNWKHAEEHPEIVQQLIDKEVEAGWVIKTDCTPDTALHRWPQGIAIGKLNVVLAEGKDPRLVLDSSICQVNKRRTLPERVALPLASDVKLAHMADDPVGAFIGASFDFKAAYKQIQVIPEEHGLLLFAHQGALYHYRVCHFGGRFSAYW